LISGVDLENNEIRFLKFFLNLDGLVWNGLREPLGLVGVDVLHGHNNPAVKFTKSYYNDTSKNVMNITFKM